MDPQELERAIHDLETKIDRLRALYNQYFMGIERLEPMIPRKDVDRLMTVLRKTVINNTAQRFRFQQQVQRYNVLSTYWQRVARQIEEGTYHRDVMRARARAEDQERQSRPPDEMEELERSLPSHEIDLDEFGDDTNPMAAMGRILDEGAGARPLKPVYDDDQPTMEELLGGSGGRPAKGPPPPPVPRSPSPSGAARRPPPIPRSATTGRELTEERMKDIYKSFVSARQKCNESVKGLSFDKVKEQLKTREAALRKKHGKDVDFEVTIKGGRAVLRAVPKD